MTAVKALETGFTLLAKAALAAGEFFPRLVGELANTGREVQLTAEKTGLSTDAVQEFGYAAKTAGVDTHEMSLGLGHLAMSMVAAQHGAKEQSEIFSRLGVKVTDATGKLRGAEDVFYDVSDAFAKMAHDDPNKQFDARVLLSRAGLNLIPLLNKGSQAFRDLAKEAQDAGVVMSRESIQSSMAYTASMRKLHGAVDGLKVTIGGPLIKVFGDLIDKGTAWLRLNRAWIATKAKQVFEAMSTAVTILWHALQVLWTLMKAVYDVVQVSVKGWGMLFNVIADLVTGLGTFGKVAGAVALYFFATWAAAAFPVVALAAILAFIFLLFDDIMVGMRGGRSVVFALFNAWSEFLDKWATPNGNDPWWLTTLKAFYWSVSHPEEFIQAFYEAFDNLIITIKQWFKSLWDDIKNGAAEVLDAINPFSGKTAVGDILKAQGFGAQAGPSYMDLVNGAVDRGTKAGTATANTTINIGAIHATTAQDAEAIAKHIRQVVDETTAVHMREALAAVKQ